MPSIKFFIKGNSPTSSIYMRFLHGRQFDFKRSTRLTIDPKNWNSNKGRVRNLAEFSNKLNTQNALNGLQSHVLGNFNSDYSEGTTINSDWLNRTIDGYFNQSNDTDLRYLTDYGAFFLENLPNKILRDGRTGVSLATIKKYRTTLVKVQEFEKRRKNRLKIDEVNLKFHKDFIHFLHNEKNLNYNTTGKYVGCLKTICIDAKKYGIKVHPDLEKDEFRMTREKTYFVTLSEEEITAIFEKDLSRTPYLDNARNWLIIGVWTGSRVSDLLKFGSDNLKDGFIQYTSQKTKQKIVLPIHWQVRAILDRNNGEFPRAISSQKYNDYIKDVCELAGINELCKGGKFNSESKRKEIGNFPKWQLISTHVARRSFATNHYGKLPTPVIMAATGHQTEKMLLAYIGKSSQDNANVLREFWEKEMIKRDHKPQLQIIKTSS